MGKHSKLYEMNSKEKVHTQVQDWLHVLKVSYN